MLWFSKSVELLSKQQYFLVKREFIRALLYTDLYCLNRSLWTCRAR